MVLLLLLNTILVLSRDSSVVADENDSKELSIARADQSSVISNLLNKFLSEKDEGSKLEQISKEEFYTLFGTARRQLRIQDVNGEDTGVQYDFIPHVESESVPESATYTFFLRSDEPQIFLLDDNLDQVENTRISQNSPRRPKVQLDIEETEQKTGFSNDALNKFEEEDRQSLRLQQPVADISLLLDDYEEEEEKIENELSQEFSTLRPDLTSISSTRFRITGKELDKMENESFNIIETDIDKPKTRTNMVDESINEISNDAISAGFDRSGVESHPRKDEKIEKVEKIDKLILTNDTSPNNIAHNPSTDVVTPLTKTLNIHGSNEEEQREVFLVNNFEIMKVLNEDDKENNSILPINKTKIIDMVKNLSTILDKNDKAFPDNQQTNHTAEQVRREKEIHNESNDTCADKKDEDIPIKTTDDMQASEREGKKQSVSNESSKNSAIMEELSDVIMSKNEDLNKNKNNKQSSIKKSNEEFELEASEKAPLKQKDEDKLNLSVLILNRTMVDNATLNTEDTVLDVTRIDKDEDKMFGMIKSHLKDTVQESIGDKHNKTGSWLKAIPFIAYWIVKYIHADPNLTVEASEEIEMKLVTQAITDNIERAVEEFNNNSQNGNFNPNLFNAAKNLTSGLLGLAEKNNNLMTFSSILKNKSNRTGTIEKLQFQNMNFEKENINKNINNEAENLTSGLQEFPQGKIKSNKLIISDASPDAHDSIHGDNVSRNDEILENHNFNALSTKPNLCNCKHGGECLPESKRCYCSHGFTGSKCQKRVRKVILIGGLNDHQIRQDSELVGGLEVQRCSPPPFPKPVMAATGETSGDTVVVCGGATITGGRLTATNTCHIWDKSDSWSAPLLMSSSRAWAASVLIPTANNHQIVVFGGIDQNNVTLDTIEVVDMESKKSIKLGLSLPKPLSGHCAIQLNSSHTFIAGGAVSEWAGLGLSANLSSQAWILSEAGWTSAGQLSVARTGHSCSTVVPGVGGVEVVVGGGIGLSEFGTRTVLDSVEVYNVATGRWRSGKKLPSPVFGAGMKELAGQPVIIGGRYQKEGELLQSDSSFVYQQSWRLSPLRMKSPRDHAAVVSAPSFC